MARILCGIDKNGKQHNEPCYAADMREFEVGRWAQIPDDEKGGMEWVRVVGYHMLTSCDYLAANSLTPFNEGATAILPCRKCDYSTKSPLAGRPFSFLKKLCDVHGNPQVGFKLHHWPTVKAALVRARVSPTDAPAIKKANGFNKLFFALDPDYIPHVLPTKVPEDGLHLGPDGILRHEGAWLFYILIKLGLDLDVVNARIREFPNFPADVRIPPLHSALKKGKRGNTPKSSSMLRMTGSQVMHFTFHRCARTESNSCEPTAAVLTTAPSFPSVALLQPLLSAQPQLTTL